MQPEPDPNRPSPESGGPVSAIVAGPATGAPSRSICRCASPRGRCASPAALKRQAPFRSEGLTDAWAEAAAQTDGVTGEA